MMSGPQGTLPGVPVPPELAAAVRRAEEPRIYSDAFQTWYAAYPRKRAPGDAWKAWKAIHDRPTVQAMLAALQWQIRTDDWTRDAGRWIPYPATYLRGRQWEDQPPARSTYCPFHQTRRNDHFPAPRPVATCPECKHVAAGRAGRVSRPAPAADVVPEVLPQPIRPSDSELASDFRRMFPGEPWPGHAEAFKRVTRKIREEP